MAPEKSSLPPFHGILPKIRSIQSAADRFHSFTPRLALRSLNAHKLAFTQKFTREHRAMQFKKALVTQTTPGIKPRLNLAYKIASLANRYTSVSENQVLRATLAKKPVKPAWQSLDMALPTATAIPSAAVSNAPIPSAEPIPAQPDRNANIPTLDELRGLVMPPPLPSSGPSQPGSFSAGQVIPRKEDDPLYLESQRKKAAREAAKTRKPELTSSHRLFRRVEEVAHPGKTDDSAASDLEADSGEAPSRPAEKPTQPAASIPPRVQREPETSNSTPAPRSETAPIPQASEIPPAVQPEPREVETGSHEVEASVSRPALSTQTENAPILPRMPAAFPARQEAAETPELPQTQPPVPSPRPAQRAHARQVIRPQVARPARQNSVRNSVSQHTPAKPAPRPALQIMVRRQMSQAASSPLPAPRPIPSAPRPPQPVTPRRIPAVPTLPPLRSPAARPTDQPVDSLRGLSRTKPTPAQPPETSVRPSPVDFQPAPAAASDSSSIAAHPAEETLSPANQNESETRPQPPESTTKPAHGQGQAPFLRQPQPTQPRRMSARPLPAAPLGISHPANANPSAHADPAKLATPAALVAPAAHAAPAAYVQRLPETSAPQTQPTNPPASESSEHSAASQAVKAPITQRPADLTSTPHSDAAHQNAAHSPAPASAPRTTGLKPFTAPRRIAARLTSQPAPVQPDAPSARKMPALVQRIRRMEASRSKSAETALPWMGGQPVPQNIPAEEPMVQADPVQQAPSQGPAPLNPPSPQAQTPLLARGMQSQAAKARRQTWRASFPAAKAVRRSSSPSAFPHIFIKRPLPQKESQEPLDLPSLLNQVKSGSSAWGMKSASTAAGFNPREFPVIPWHLEAPKDSPSSSSAAQTASTPPAQPRMPGKEAGPSIPSSSRNSAASDKKESPVKPSDQPGLPPAQSPLPLPGLGQTTFSTAPAVVQRIPSDASDSGAANEFAPDGEADEEGSESQSKKVSIKTIADQVYPMILRRLEVEKERSFGRLHSNR